MGNYSSQVFTEQELRQYEKCTFLARNEILKLYSIFIELGKKGNQPKKGLSKSSGTLTIEELSKFPCLSANPFKERIIKIFSSREDGQQTWDEFVDMCSAFSPHAPKDIKVYVAFNLFDYHGDGVIDEEDILLIVGKMVGENMQPEEIKRVAANIFAEADTDHSGTLSYREFVQLTNRLPEFERNFTFRIL